MRRISWIIVAVLLLFCSAGVAGATRHAAAQAAPTLTITSPSNGATVAAPATITVAVTGVTIKAASEGDPNSSHLHYFVDKDPANIVKPGQPIPTGDPNIIHSGSLTQQLPSLGPGQHHVWVVLGHLDHTPYSPNVQADVTFTVSGAAASTPAAGAAAGAPTAGGASALPATGRAGRIDTIDRNHVVTAAVLAGLLVLAGAGGLYWERRLRTR
jgi:hypothetical protein